MRSMWPHSFYPLVLRLSTLKPWALAVAVAAVMAAQAGAAADAGVRIVDAAVIHAVAPDRNVPVVVSHVLLENLGPMALAVLTV